MEWVFVMCPQNSYLSKSGSVYMGEKAEILKVRIADYLNGLKGNRVFFREKHAIGDAFFVGEKTHSITVTKDYQVEKSLKPLADLFFDKTRYSAFYNTELDSFISRNKVTLVKMMGIETHTSILFTAEELKNRGIDVEIIEPCSMSSDDYLHSSAINIMVNFLGIRLGN